MDQNWDDLRVFLQVARLGGLTPAAHALKMDPATVGRRIARLEAARGTVLFQKSPQGYALTLAGQGLVDHIATAETALAQGLNSLSQTTDQLQGPVRIGAPDGVANYVLPQVCAQMARDHPDLDLQIVALPRIFNLSQREADMVIGVSPPTAARLLVQKICDYRLWMAAHRDHQGDDRVVGYIPDMIFDSELDYLRDLGWPRVHMASNSIAVQMNLLRQNCGVGVVHAFAMSAAPELQRITSDFELTRSYYLIRGKEDKKDQRLTRVADILRRSIRTQVAALEHAALGNITNSR